MLRKILTALVLVPVGILLVVLSVANRQMVSLRLDPFSEVGPAISIDMPFFVFIFSAVLTGLVIGGIATWFSQGVHRRRAARLAKEAQNWQAEAERQKKRADDLAAAATGSSLVPVNPGRQAA
ncbi:MAG: LapA family protein [Rhizobiaceae bacterium]